MLLHCEPVGLRCPRSFPGYAGLPGAVGHREMCSCIHWDCPYPGGSAPVSHPIPYPSHLPVLWIHTWDPKTPILQPSPPPPSVAHAARPVTWMLLHTLGLSPKGHCPCCTSAALQRDLCDISPPRSSSRRWDHTGCSSSSSCLLEPRDNPMLVCVHEHTCVHLVGRRISWAFKKRY